MFSTTVGRKARIAFCSTLALAAVAWVPQGADAGVKIFENETLTTELGIRMQPRMELENINNDVQRDFLVRRTRLKLTGKAHKATYNFEWRLDRTDYIVAGQDVGLENGYIQYPVGGGAAIRVGLYDAPYSRDRLTSDSKQLVVDRGLVSNVPAGSGLADNVVGAEVVGKINGGRVEYAAGVFDNRTIEGSLQDIPMVCGRLDVNLGATNDVFHDAHFGDARWCSFGLNGNYQGEIENPAGAHDGSRGAFGVDGMVDVPAGPGRLLVRGEMNVVEIVAATGGNSVDSRVYMAGLGYLVWNQRFQPTIRFDQWERDVTDGGGTVNVTYVGANWYQDRHMMKIQADVRFQSGTGESFDGARLQAQLDF